MKIVLLPGLDGTGILFKPLIESLSSGFDPLVICYPTDKKMNYTELRDFVMHLLPESEEFVLVGESFSGPIAYQIALENPENLKSVIFVASFLSNPHYLALSFSRFIPKRMLLSLSPPEFIIKLFLLGAEASERLINLFRRAISEVPADILSYRLNEIASLPSMHQQCSIRAVYIQATEDRLVPSKCIDEFKQVMENVSVFQVDGPHFILQASPSRCAEILTNEVHLISDSSV